MASKLLKCIFLLSIIFALFASTDQGHVVNGHIEERVCIGTNGRLSVPSNRDHHYRNLRDRYTNCTYVDGNLELTWLQDESLDLSFLQHIREVTGYVLVSHVDVRRIVLPRLQIIRGRTHFKMTVREEEFALIVTLSKMFSLELPALRDVLSGSVGLINNYNLCHVKTINWKEIVTDPIAHYIYTYNFTSPERECTDCDKSCVSGCWGEGPKNCQKFSKENCSPQCYQGRCFGPNPRECCHLFCAGGCTGPKQSDCLACRNFYDNGVCTQECPPMQRYNSITYSWEPNPDGKYAYGATCVKKCPKHLLKDSGACVRSCPENKKAVNDECVPCDGPCPKNCQGDKIIHSGNIDSFKDCTVIEGFLQILDTSFMGYLDIYSNYTLGQKYDEMHPDRLEVFSTLKEITGFLNIQGDHKDFTNLSYFRNLETIGGRTLTDFFSSLYIVKTSLKSLEMHSLKTIKSGSVTILENKDLCYAQSINWRHIRRTMEHDVTIHNNRNRTECEREGFVCDQQCSSEGCWGSGPDQCLSCANFKLRNTCIQDCSSQAGIYKAGPKVCAACHSQCSGSCNGPGPDDCNQCKFVKDGPFCVPACPSSKYADSGVCYPCHANCAGGCTGPLNTVGIGGCNSCHRAIINERATVQGCLRQDEPCPDGYYYEWVGPQEQGALKPLAGYAICRQCHPRCQRCTGYGFHEQVCQECTRYKRGEQCEDECPLDHWSDDTNHKCVACDSECRECRGPGPSGCLKCRNYKVFKPDTNNTVFDCVAQCPPHASHKVFPQDDVEPFCSEEPPRSGLRTDDDRTPAILAGGGACVVLLLLFLACVSYQWRRKAIAKENAVKMTMALTGLEDNEPLRPTNVQPNLARLRIVTEAELRKGGILGCGAFGTVFKGVWVPEGENAKIPVAIKVLREGTGVNTNKEFLDEAYIMASVDHPNLLQLLAVCMTSEMMLVTQLMPLGCLLDFVRTHKDRIGSKALLNWCTQIAKGMSYLEENRLVHRDLAARNVLVQTPNCVKITDFGLAKLLDINEEEYKAAGGKMPIKWLALECIQHRIFTHKSDVWAFGVTVWELLTYGGRPYEHISAKDVPELLEKGERLPQPNICTIDVYMLMIKCWMLDAESRPGFKELADEFAKMARDPGRYLVIPGDRLMRLPHFTQEAREHMQNLVIDTSDSLTSNDEYLQPKSRAPISSSTSSSPPMSFKPWPGSNDDNHHNRAKELLRYTGIDTGDNSRYCGDPMKMLSPDDDSSSSNKREAHVGSLKLDLPLDEDDYLMPSPQQAQTVTAYVDLIGDSKHYDGATNSCYGNFPDFLPHVPKTNIDNPEYLMNDASMQTLGIPTISETVQVKNNGTRNGTPKTSEEESDHEYYNDFDRLQRELQPLRKSETAV